MDRVITYPGAIPLVEDLLNVERNTMSAIGYALQATLGTGTVADGLACGPVAPPSMTLQVGPGSITSFTTVDATPFSTLPASSLPLVKMGIVGGYTPLDFVAPSGAGTSVDYLIEAMFSEPDTGSVIIPYYDAANPSNPWSGPGGGGAALVFVRQQTVSLRLVEGAPAVSGTQVPPGADAGWVPLYVVTVPAGATQLTAANIAVAAGAPFIGAKIPQLDAAVAALQSAVSAAQTSTGSETTRAEAAEAALNAAIGAETVRAEAAEANLNTEINTAVAAETARAEAAEASLNTAIGTEASTRNTAVGNEATARAAGDSAVSASIGPAVAAAIAAAIANDNNQPGYVKIGSTFLMWGQGTISNGSAGITFPMSFPNACYNVFPYEVDGSGWIYNGGLNPVSYTPSGPPSQSGCSIIGVTNLATGGTQANNGGGFNYMAIGC